MNGHVENQKCDVRKLLAAWLRRDRTGEEGVGGIFHAMEKPRAKRKKERVIRLERTE